MTRLDPIPAGTGLSHLGTFAQATHSARDAVPHLVPERLLKLQGPGENTTSATFADLQTGFE